MKPVFCLVYLFAATLPAFSAESVEDRVRALDDRERLAALQRDVRALEELWSDDFTVNAPNNRVVTGKKAVLDMFVHSGVIDFSTFDRSIEYIKADGDKVIVMGLETVVPEADAPAAGLKAGVAVKRRFTKTGKGFGMTVIDDYGHHPVEIAATLKAAREAQSITNGRVIAVVQPHRYTRLRDLMKEFCNCFNDADIVVVADVYSAGEEPIEGVVSLRRSR